MLETKKWLRLRKNIWNSLCKTNAAELYSIFSAGETEEKLHIIMVDNHIPAGAKLYELHNEAPELQTVQGLFASFSPVHQFAPGVVPMSGIRI